MAAYNQRVGSSLETFPPQIASHLVLLQLVEQLSKGPGVYVLSSLLGLMESSSPQQVQQALSTVLTRHRTGATNRSPGVKPPPELDLDADN
jgi:hypothetical protein